jgi:hypothetical protein
MCKIYKIGSIYWAMSGLTNESSTKYDVARIVAQSYRPDRTIADLLRAFEKNVETPLQNTMIRYQTSPQEFSKVKNHPLEIAFWGFEGGKSVIAAAYYTTEIIRQKASIKKENEIILNCSIPNDCSGRTEATMLGVHDEIVSHLQSHRDWARHDLGKTAYSLIELSINEARDTVGYPISVLVVHSDGSFKWEKSNECCFGTPADRRSFPPRRH